jgi:glycosyltransferase involved in cell wall biosynthesis
MIDLGDASTISVEPAEGAARADGSGGSRGHVLVVVENVPLGIDPRLRKQVLTLLTAGYRVSVITRRDPANDACRRLPGLTVLEHPPPKEPGHAVGYLREYLVAFGWAAVLSAWARAGARVDVVQFCQPPDVYFPLARLLRCSGATVVVDQRDLMPELFATRYGGGPPVVQAALRWLERRTQRVADYAIGVNEYLRIRIVGAGARPDRVAVVRNGPRLDAVAAARPDPELRAGARFLCCWQGKMGRQDRVDLLLEAVAELVHHRGRHDCRFLLLGDGECLEELRADVRHRGLDRWVALPGWLSEPELYRHLASSDLGLDTSLQVEVSPVKAMEYMAFGLPVVAFDLLETVRTVGDAAVLVPPADIGCFADAVEALLDDGARRAALGKAGRRRIAEELCWERQAATYLSVIDRAVGFRPGSLWPARGRRGNGERT